MKLGIVPLWSAWKDLSNDVLRVDFNVGHIFAKSALDQRLYIIHGFSWFWVKIQPTAKWTSFECSIHADHNGANPSYVPQNLMRLSPCDAATETGLLSGAGRVFIAPCVLALQTLESDHLEKLQARPEFTVFSHKDGSTSNSLESCADLQTYCRCVCVCSFVSDVSLGRSFSAVHMGAVIVPGILNFSHHVQICNIILAALIWPTV